MSLDLSAAVEAAHNFIAEEVGWDAGIEMREQARRAVNVVAPLIEQAVREQVAREIEALRNKALTSQRADDDEEQIAYIDGRLAAFREALHLARGGAS